MIIKKKVVDEKYTGIWGIFDALLYFWQHIPIIQRSTSCHLKSYNFPIHITEDIIS